MRALFLVAALLLAGCATPSEPPGSETTTACEPTLSAPDPSWKAERPRVRLETTRGVILVELDVERAPVTAQHVLSLVESGFYDGTSFHRIVKDFVIQGGDPLSKDEDPRNDGTGGPVDAEGNEIAIPDEFHPALRHDAAGVLSMANSGPNTGGSQFFITLGATPHLDDRHSVFGRVVEGMDVVRAIGESQVDANERPVEPVVLTKAERVGPATFEAEHGADAHVVVPSKKAEPGRGVKFAVVLQNTGSTRDAMALAVFPPSGWACRADAPVTVAAGTGRVVFLTLTPPAGASGTVDIPVQVRSAHGATGEDAVSIVMADLGGRVTEGDKVVANYAGLLPDGRLFDTSMPGVGQDPEQPKFATMGGWRDKPTYGTFPFTVGSGVIPGFTNLAKTAKVGETVTGLIPAKDAYATGNVYERPLTGRDLVFELEIVSRN